MYLCEAIVFLISVAAFGSGEELPAATIARLLHRRVPSGTVMTRLGGSLAYTYNTAQSETCDPEYVSCEGNSFTFCGIGGINQTVKCSDIFDGKPGFCDCDNAYCLPERPKCPNSKCTKLNEKLPDPWNCRAFTYCDGSVRSVFECPDKFTYNPSIEACDPSNICIHLQCNPKKVIEFIPFPQSPEYYLFCSFGVSEVRKCSQPEYRMEKGRCQYSCMKPGLFRDPNKENCLKGYWYSCSKQNGNTFHKQTKRCPKGQNGNQLYFNEVLGICSSSDTCSEGQKEESTPPTKTE